MVEGIGPICQRIAAATIGGYALVTGASICISYILPMPRFDAVLTAVLIAIWLYVGIVLWAFFARPLRRMWWGLGTPTVVCLLLATLLSPAPP